MLYNYKKYQIITHFFIILGLKNIIIVINNTLVVHNSYFKFYISNFLSINKKNINKSKCQRGRKNISHCVHDDRGGGGVPENSDS